MEGGATWSRGPSESETECHSEPGPYSSACRCLKRGNSHRREPSQIQPLPVTKHTSFRRWGVAYMGRFAVINGLTSRDSSELPPSHGACQVPLKGTTLHRERELRRMLSLILSETHECFIRPPGKQREIKPLPMTSSDCLIMGRL